MKCPQCGGRELTTYSAEVTGYRSTISFDDDGTVAEWENDSWTDGDDAWIHPDAETECDACNHRGAAIDFAEDADYDLVAPDEWVHLYRIGSQFARQNDARFLAAAAMLSTVLESIGATVLAGKLMDIKRSHLNAPTAEAKL